MCCLCSFQLNQDKMNFSTLRNIQGLFAPLKLQMEFKAVQQVGFQVSLLHASHLCAELIGRSLLSGKLYRTSPSLLACSLFYFPLLGYDLHSYFMEKSSFEMGNPFD